MERKGDAVDGNAAACRFGIGIGIGIGHTVAPGSCVRPSVPDGDAVLDPPNVDEMGTARQCGKRGMDDEEASRRRRGPCRTGGERNARGGPRGKVGLAILDPVVVVPATVRVVRVLVLLVTVAMVTERGGRNVSGKNLEIIDFSKDAIRSTSFVHSLTKRFGKLTSDEATEPGLTFGRPVGRR